MRTNFIIAISMLFSGAIYAQTTVNAADIIKKINSKQAVSYENVTIQGNLDLTTPIENKKQERESSSVIKGINITSKTESKNMLCMIEVPITFKNCTFKGEVIGYIPDEKTKEKNTIYSAQFEKGASFNGCTFEKDVNFKYTEFKSKGEFKGATFKQLAFFKYSEFPTKAIFESAEFSGETCFKYTEFYGGVTFANSKFNDEVTFKYTEFSGEINFSGASFKDDAIFKYTEFPKGVNFSNTIFNGFADFKYAKIYKSDFEKAQFKGSTDTKYISLK